VVVLGASSDGVASAFGTVGDVTSSLETSLGIEGVVLGVEGVMGL
jgi:hypothetical protein